MNAQQFEEIDHTADTGLRIWGSSLKVLFINAANGMFNLILRGSPDLLPPHFRDEPDYRRSLHLQASSIELLLKDWLAELLYIHTTEHIFFTEFTISTHQGTTLDGEAAGYRFTREEEHLFTEIKAVTYHGLQISETDNGYQAQVIFDI